MKARLDVVVGKELQCRCAEDAAGVAGGVAGVFKVHNGQFERDSGSNGRLQAAALNCRAAVAFTLSHLPSPGASHLVLPPGCQPI